MTAPTPRIDSYTVPALPPLAAVRDRAEEARERRMQLREDGFADGFQAGLDAAAAQIDAELAEHRRAAGRLDRLADALGDAVRDLAARDRVALEDIEADVVALAVSLAEAILERELAIVDEPVLEALRRAVRLLPDRGAPLVRVHPDDATTTSAAVAADVLRWPAGVSVVPDRSVEPGGCVVEVGSCRVDAQLATAIERMRDALC